MIAQQSHCASAPYTEWLRYVSRGQIPPNIGLKRSVLGLFCFGKGVQQDLPATLTYSQKVV